MFSILKPIVFVWCAIPHRALSMLAAMMTLLSTLALGFFFLLANMLDGGEGNRVIIHVYAQPNAGLDGDNVQDDALDDASAPILTTPDFSDAQVEEMIQALNALPGLDEARVFQPQDFRESLDGWLSVDDLSLPWMLEAKAEDYQRTQLHAALEPLLAGWQWQIHDYRDWQTALLQTVFWARALLLGFVAALFIATGSAMVYAVRSITAARRQEMDILRTLGASDRHIAGRIIRPMLLALLLGCGIGALPALFALSALGGMIGEISLAWGATILSGSQYVALLAVMPTLFASAAIFSYWRIHKHIRAMDIQVSASSGNDRRVP